MPAEAASSRPAAISSRTSLETSLLLRNKRWRGLGHLAILRRPGFEPAAEDEPNTGECLLCLTPDASASVSWGRARRLRVPATRRQPPPMKLRSRASPHHWPSDPRDLQLARRIFSAAGLNASGSSAESAQSRLISYQQTCYPPVMPPTSIFESTGSGTPKPDAKSAVYGPKQLRTHRGNTKLEAGLEAGMTPSSI